jgi:putative acetyltransferase
MFLMFARDIEIRPFQSEDSPAFRLLNEAWISKYFSLENEDRVVLGNPGERILKRGGHIFMAVSDDKCVGCCALILLRPGVFEVAKMAVAEEYRGRGIGRKLLEYTIAQAKALGAKSLFLGSNTRLKDAIHLYESAGFRHLPPERVPPSPYVRANVFMELHFENNGAGPSRRNPALVS